MKYLMLVLLLAVTACTTPLKKPEPPIVQNKCLGKVPAKPQYSFEQLSKPKDDIDAANAVKVLYLDFKSALQYGLDWETAASGCL